MFTFLAFLFEMSVSDAEYLFLCKLIVSPGCFVNEYVNLRTNNFSLLCSPLLILIFIMKIARLAALEGVSVSRDANNTLSLTCRRLRSAAAGVFNDAMKLLGQSVFVTSIDLQDNGIGAEGAAALSQALLVNTSITSVNVYGNGIGAEGAAALARAIAANEACALKTLSGVYLNTPELRAMLDIDDHYDDASVSWAGKSTDDVLGCLLEKRAVRPPLLK